MLRLLILLIFIPFCSFLVTFFFSFWFGRVGTAIITCVSSFIGFLISLICLFLKLSSKNDEIVFFKFDVSWIKIKNFVINWEFYFDNLTVVMCLIVFSISFLVNFYSVEYMRNEPEFNKFFCYLSLFTFFMIILVTSSNFITLFFGWEGVGLCSFLLISFWSTRVQAVKAAVKAMLVNKIGDFFLLVAISLLFYNFKTLDFLTIFSLCSFFKTQVVFANLTIIDLICLCLVVSAMAKSAQIGLHSWLPDAMEGPTPVSALIHAATTVTAGIFLIIRCSFLFELSEIARTSMVYIGLTTMFVSGLIGLAQFDIKKIIAYSTCSQLGCMFFACGLSLYNASLFHMFNHAFFKALLFLSAGIIIHSLKGEQDLRYMSRINSIFPITWSSLTIGLLSLIGIPFMSGFYSKDYILLASYSYEKSQFVFIFAMLSIIVTSLYSLKIIYYTFFSPCSLSKKNMYATESNSIFFHLPQVILALLSVFLGYFSKEIFLGLNTTFFENSIAASPKAVVLLSYCMPFLVKLIPVFMIICGFLLFKWFFIDIEAWEEYLVTYNFTKPIYMFFNKKLYFDSLVNFILFKFYKLSHLSYQLLDKGLFEIIGPTGIINLLRRLEHQFLRFFQNGRIDHYFLIITISLITFFIIFYQVSLGDYHLKISDYFPNNIEAFFPFFLNRATLLKNSILFRTPANTRTCSNKLDFVLVLFALFFLKEFYGTILAFFIERNNICLLSFHLVSVQFKNKKVVKRSNYFLNTTFFKSFSTEEDKNENKNANLAGNRNVNTNNDLLAMLEKKKNTELDSRKISSKHIGMTSDKKQSRFFNIKKLNDANQPKNLNISSRGTKSENFQPLSKRTRNSEKQEVSEGGGKQAKKNYFPQQGKKISIDKDSGKIVKKSHILNNISASSKQRAGMTNKTKLPTYLQEGKVFLKKKYRSGFFSDEQLFFKKNREHYNSTSSNSINDSKKIVVDKSLFYAAVKDFDLKERIHWKKKISSKISKLVEKKQALGSTQTLNQAGAKKLEYNLLIFLSKIRFFKKEMSVIFGICRKLNKIDIKQKSSLRNVNSGSQSAVKDSVRLSSNSNKDPLDYYSLELSVRKLLRVLNSRIEFVIHRKKKKATITARKQILRISIKILSYLCAVLWQLILFSLGTRFSWRFKDGFSWTKNNIVKNSNVTLYYIIKATLKFTFLFKEIHELNYFFCKKWFNIDGLIIRNFRYIHNFFLMDVSSYGAFKTSLINQKTQIGLAKYKTVKLFEEMCVNYKNQDIINLLEKFSELSLKLIDHYEVLLDYIKTYSEGKFLENKSLEVAESTRKSLELSVEIITVLLSLIRLTYDWNVFWNNTNTPFKQRFHHFILNALSIQFFSIFDNTFYLYSKRNIILGFSPSSSIPPFIFSRVVSISWSEDYSS